MEEGQLARGLLSPREEEIRFWFWDGKTLTEAAYLMGVSKSTVKSYKDELYKKLGVHTPTGAAYEPRFSDNGEITLPTK